MSHFNNEELKVIIIMMKRASCTGQESGAVASVITKAEATYLEQERKAAEAPDLIIEHGDGERTEVRSVPGEIIEKPEDPVEEEDEQE